MFNKSKDIQLLHNKMIYYILNKNLNYQEWCTYLGFFLVSIKTNQIDIITVKNFLSALLNAMVKLENLSESEYFYECLKFLTNFLEQLRILEHQKNKEITVEDIQCINNKINENHLKNR